MTIAKQINWKTIMAGTALSAMLVLSACSGGGEEAPEEEPTSEPGTTEDASTEVDDTDEAGTDDNETPDSDSGDADESSDELSWGEGETQLELGETGEIHSTLGKYDITVSNVSYPETVDGEPIGYEDATYVLVDVSINNKTENALPAEEVSISGIGSKDDAAYSENRTIYEEIENFTGEIPPGETMEGEVLFRSTMEDEFQIRFGNSAVSNELFWNFEGPNAE
ncbi:DUF4352 domain-containing protein [Aureibacillus halotolerans]|uniref:Uncharacterized protein DUF4352 n=1 Tax=Aureibacillus halotolerans TaxID=1508390 RepID=A0A4V3D615_9BACI|nr:DUF4352 domain-containing protein [Aureibacillus halotolerans]TDQ42207.1 uncharacterized protein DUF4352 [Aureibacillus halotolerans]